MSFLVAAIAMLATDATRLLKSFRKAAKWPRGEEIKGHTLSSTQREIFFDLLQRAMIESITVTCSRRDPAGGWAMGALGPGPSQSFGVYPALSLRAAYAPPNRRWPMILSAIAEKLKRRSKDDFKGRHFEAALILQAVSWYLRYPLSYRDIEELFLERGLEVDHSTLNRWVLAYAPLIEKPQRAFRQPHCGSIRVDETYIKIRGQWRYCTGPSTSTETRLISSSRRSATWRPPSGSFARR